MIPSHLQRGKKMGYSALANEAWGRYGLLAVDFALFITLMGAGVAYFVFIETTMIHGKHSLLSFLEQFAILYAYIGMQTCQSMERAKST